MPDYRLRWSKLAGKELDRLPSQIAVRIARHIDDLAVVPRPSGSLKLKGSFFWRIRVGDYRVVYAIDDVEKMISIMYVRHRKDVYRDL
jgi:mRNA interferase RelE/StbE